MPSPSGLNVPAAAVRPLVVPVTSGAGGDGCASEGPKPTLAARAVERCRIIGVGVADARRRHRPRDWLSSLESLASRAPQPAACAVAPLRSRSGREQSAPAVLAVRGPIFGVEYLVRQARITDIDRLASIGHASMERSGRGSLDAADLMRQLVYLPNASLLVAEVAARARGRRTPRPSAVGRRRRLRRHHRPVGRRTRSRRGPRHRRTTGGAPAVREQQGLLDGRGRRTLRSSGPRPPRAGGLRHRRANALAVRRGGRCNGPPNLAPWAAGKAGPPPHHRSQCGQERRRLRGRGEHLLRGQGGRRGHRLRHAAEVGHRRTRFRPRVRVHRARPGQREPAQLPPVPRAAPVQGRQQGHPQVRRRQGQGEPRHRARRRPDEDRAQPRHRRHRVGRRRLRLRDPRRPGDGRPVRGHQLPRQHVVGPDRGRRPVHRHHPDRPRRQELHAFGPPGRGRRGGPVDDRGPREAVRGHRAWSWPRSWPWPAGT